MATTWDQYLLNKRKPETPGPDQTDPFLGFVLDKMGLGDPAKPESTPVHVAPKPTEPDTVQQMLDVASGFGMPTFDPRPGQEQRNLERFVGKPPDLSQPKDPLEALLKVLESVGSQQTGPQVTPFGMFDPRMLDVGNNEKARVLNRFGDEIARGEMVKPTQAKRVGEATSRWIQAGPGKQLDVAPEVQELAKRGASPMLGAGVKRIDTSKMSATRQKVLGMYQDVPVVPGTGTRQGIVDTATAVDRIIWDDKVGLKQLQETAAREAGHVLSADEMALQGAKRNADFAAKVMVQDGLQIPVLQYIGEQNEPLLAEYLTYMDNIDVAEAMGRKVELAELAKPLRVKGTAALKKAQQRVNYWSTGAGSKLANAAQKLTAAQKRLATAQANFAKNKTAAESVQSTKASAKGAKVEAARKFSTDIDVAKSRDALDEFRRTTDPALMAKIDEAHRRVQAFVEQFRQLMVDTGTWPKELAEQFRKDYPNFVPTRIIDYMESGSEGTKLGTTISVRDQGIRENTIEGTARIREDPLTSLIRMTYQGVALGRKNEVFNRFVNLRNASQTLQGEMLEYVSDVANNMLAPGQTNHIGPGEELVTGYINGVKTQYVVAADVAKTIDMRRAIPPELEPLQDTMTLFKMLITSRNPAFLPVNLTRDTGSALVIGTMRQGSITTLPEVALEIVRMMPEAFKGITRGEYHGKLRDVLWEGGGMAGYYQYAPKRMSRRTLAQKEEDIVRASQEQIHELSNPRFIGINTKDGLITILTDIAKMKPAEAIGERLEMALRLPGYTLAERRGENKAMQVSDFRTGSGLDFNEAGTLTRILNVFFPFSNVAAQAAKLPYRLVTEATEPGRLSAAGGNKARWNRVAMGITLLTVPTVLAEAWNRRDAETSAIYDDIPQAIKDRAIVLVMHKGMKDRSGNRRPVILYLSTSEFSPIVQLTREALARVYNKPGRSWDDLAHGIMRTLSPVGDLGADTLLMPFAGTAAQLGVDTNFYSGNRISSMAADDNASRAAKVLSLGTSRIPLANKVIGRPSQVEFAMRDALGGLGKMASQVSDVGSGKQTLPQSIPVLGTAMSGVVRSDIGGNLERAAAQRLSGVSEQRFRDLGMSVPGEVGHEINGVPLTIAERARYQELFNQSIKSILAQINRTKAPISPSARESLQRQIDIARDRAKNTVYRSISASEKSRRTRQKQEQVSVRGTLKGIIGR